MPLADDTMKCQLVPLSRESYSVTFTDAQWERLQAAFPNGVCDYSQPSVGREQTVPWLTYQDANGSVVYGGTPLGAAPLSISFAPTGQAAPNAAPATAAAPSRALPATGGVPLAALTGLALLAAAGYAGRRRRASAHAG